MKKTFILTNLVILATLLFSCDNEIGSETKNQSDEIIINNDVSFLDKRIATSNQLIGLTDISTKTKTKSIVTSDSIEYQLVLRATVSSPEISSKKLRASHIKIYNNSVYVSYNYEGNDYAGGVDVFDVTDISSPKLLSQALFPAMDISALDCYNGKIYLAGSIDIDKTNNSAITSPATLKVVTLNNNLLTDTSNSINLNGYVATGVSVNNSKIYVTTGDNGSLYMIDRTNLTTLSASAMSDLRSIDLYGDIKVAMQGSPAKISIIDANDNITNSYSYDGASTIWSKSYIDMDANYTYVPLNENGLAVIKTSTGEKLTSFARPEIPEGATASDYVTNGVSVLEDFVFIANGGAGLYIAEKGSNGIPSLKVSADLGASANFVEAKRNLNGNIVIFVATGTGGLKILELIRTVKVVEPTIPKYEVVADTVNDYLSEFDNYGFPKNIIKTTVSSKLLDTYNKFISQVVIPKKQFDAIISGQPYYLVTNAKTKLWLKYISEGAGFNNSLGYYYFNINNPPKSLEDIKKRIVIFPNCSDKGTSAFGLTKGDKVMLGEFPENTAIGFFIYSDGWDSSTKKIDMTKKNMLGKSKETQYSNPNYNLNKKTQHLFLYDKTKDVMFLSFEDISVSTSDSDKDYDDLIFSVEDENDAIDVNKLIDMGNFVK